MATHAASKDRKLNAVIGDEVSLSDQLAIEEGRGRKKEKEAMDGADRFCVV